MAKPWEAPTARISAKARSFADVVRDIRYCVFSIIRLRPDPPDQDKRYNATALGSGFFVAPTVLLSCNHVMNGIQAPHQHGDKYQLLQNMGTKGIRTITMPFVEIDQQLHLFPDKDAAILQTPANIPQPYASIGYTDTAEGVEIGVAGYPLPQIAVGPKGDLQFPGFFYRVAKGVITSTIRQHLNPMPNPLTTELGTIEVNFLFVPGNSGGPVFDAETGRVLAYVHGFTNREIAQNVADTNKANIDAGAEPKYIQSLHAVYSLAIRLDNIRTELERFGVTL